MSSDGWSPPRTSRDPFLPALAGPLGQVRSGSVRTTTALSDCYSIGLRRCQKEVSHAVPHTVRNAPHAPSPLDGKLGRASGQSCPCHRRFEPLQPGRRRTGRKAASRSRSARSFPARTAFVPAPGPAGEGRPCARRRPRFQLQTRGGRVLPGPPKGSAALGPSGSPRPRSRSGPRPHPEGPGEREMRISENPLPEFIQEIAGTQDAGPRSCPEARLQAPFDVRLDAVAGRDTWRTCRPWVALTVGADEFDAAPVSKAVEPPPSNTADFRTNVRQERPPDVRAATAGPSDEELLKPQSLLSNRTVLFTLSKAAVLRSVVMNHLIHHRAQLGVSLRMNEIAVRSVYGPSADEPSPPALRGQIRRRPRPCRGLMSRTSRQPRHFLRHLPPVTHSF